MLPKLMIGINGKSDGGPLKTSDFGISTVQISNIGYMFVFKLSETMDELSSCICKSSMISFDRFSNTLGNGCCAAMENN